MVENVKLMKVSTNGDPTQVATAILLALETKPVVKLCAVGEALKTLMKAISYTSVFNSNKMDLKFTPGLEYTTGDVTNTSLNTFTMTVENLSMSKQSTFKQECEVNPNSKNIELVKVLNNEALIKGSLEYYTNQGYKLLDFTPVYKQGKTSYFYAIFER